MLASAPESSDAPRTIRDYADTVWAIGKLREPQRFLTEAEFNLFMAHAVGQRVLGDHHRETLTCMDHLAGVRLASATATAPAPWPPWTRATTWP